MEMKKGATPSPKKNSNSPNQLVLLGTFLLLFGALAVSYFFYPYFQEIHLEKMTTLRFSK